MNLKASSETLPSITPATYAEILDASQDTKSNARRAVKQPKPRLTSLSLLLSDLLMLILATQLGSQVGLWFNSNVRPDIFLQLWPLLAVFLITYAVVGLYPGVGLNPVDELQRLSNVTTVVYLVVVLALFLVKDLQTASRGIYLTSWFLSLILVPLGRATLRHFFAAKSWWGVPVLVLGAGKTANLLINRLHGNPGYGLKVLACLDDNSSKQGLLNGVSVVGPLSHAGQLADHFKIRHAIVAMPGVHPTHLTKLLRRYAAVFPHLIIVPDLFGMASLGISARDFGGVMGLHARQNLLLRRNRVLKRMLDIILLIPAVIIALPIVAVAALWIILADNGSPFYAQEREGYHGAKIKVWKLRTMYRNADALLEQHLKENPDARLEWERFFKLKRDPRILPGAGILRKASLDELPQLWNIIRGNMSFIGPRPFPYYHLESFHEDFRALRCEAKPGITGLWQVSARSDGDIEVQEQLDSYYIRNWSLWLDIYVLARTPWAVIFGQGAY